jgi:hypothetical protein
MSTLKTPAPTPPLNTHAIGYASFLALALAIILDPAIRTTLAAAIVHPTITSVGAVVVGVVAFAFAYLGRPITVPHTEE